MTNPKATSENMYNQFQEDVLLRFACPYTPESKFECDLNRFNSKKPRCPFAHVRSSTVFTRANKHHRRMAEQYKRDRITPLPNFDGPDVAKLIGAGMKRLQPVFCLEHLEGRCDLKTRMRKDGYMFCENKLWHPTPQELDKLSGAPRAIEPGTLKPESYGGTSGQARTEVEVIVPPLYSPFPEAIVIPRVVVQQPAQSGISSHGGTSSVIASTVIASPSSSSDSPSAVISTVSGHLDVSARSQASSIEDGPHRNGATRGWCAQIWDWLQEHQTFTLISTMGCFLVAVVLLCIALAHLKGR